MSDYRMALRSVDEWNDEDRMDDIVVRHVDMFRMEQMDKRYWWMACYLDPNAEERLVFHVSYNKKTKEIEVHVEEYPQGDHIYEDRIRLHHECQSLMNPCPCCGRTREVDAETENDV